MLNTRLTWILSLVLVSACAKASTGPAPELPPVPISQPEGISPVSPQPNLSPSSRVWQIIPSNRPIEYVSSVKTHIQQSANSEQEDSSYLQTRYSVKLDRKTDLTSIEGSVTSFSLQSGQRIGIDAVSLTFPVSFKGQSANHEIRLESSGSSSSTSTIACEASSQIAISAAQRNIFIMPLQIRTGESWQDSSSSTVCNGPIPLNLIDRRDYRLIGETEYQGLKVLMITRNEKALFYGEGSQDQHRVIIRGETIGTAQLYADPMTGLLLNISADNKTTLSIEASGRVQQFLQTAKEITTRAN